MQPGTASGHGSEPGQVFQDEHPGFEQLGATHGDLVDLEVGAAALPILPRVRNGSHVGPGRRGWVNIPGWMRWLRSSSWEGIRSPLLKPARGCQLTGVYGPVKT